MEASLKPCFRMTYYIPVSALDICSLVWNSWFCDTVPHWIVLTTIFITQLHCEWFTSAPSAHGSYCKIHGEIMIMTIHFNTPTTAAAANNSHNNTH